MLTPTRLVGLVAPRDTETGLLSLIHADAQPERAVVGAPRPCVDGLLRWERPAEFLHRHAGVLAVLHADEDLELIADVTGRRVERLDVE
jgi:hypothetical protein